MRIFAVRLRNDGSSLKILKDKVQVASTETKIIESVDFFMKLRVPESNLKNKKYTKKSLILAQDER